MTGPGAEPGVDGHYLITEETTHNVYAGLLCGRAPEGHYVLSFDLPAGRRLTFAFPEEMAAAIRTGLSPIEVAQADALGRLQRPNGRTL